MTTHRELAIQRLVECGIRLDLAAVVADIVIESFAETPEPITGRYIRIGEIEVDTQLKLIRLRGRFLKLSPKEFRLIEYFCVHIGKVISVRQILHDLWGRAQAEYSEMYRQRLCVYISQVNKELGFKFIQNRQGFGYYSEWVDATTEA